MYLKNIKKGLSPVCYMSDGRLVCYRHGQVLIIQNEKELCGFQISAGLRERLLGRSRLLTRLFRLGVRAAIPIDCNRVILCIGKALYELNLSTGDVSKGWHCEDGARPLFFTEITGIASFNNGVYFGGYLVNMDKRAVSIFRRNDVDKWDVVYTFPQGVINHVHNVVADPYRNCLWVFTGDFDDAAAIWKVTENFSKVERVVCGDQKYRACIAFALPEGLLYATDAPFTDDYIYLLNPVLMETKEIFPIHGSCIYGCKWKDKFVFSSTVESDGLDENIMESLFGRRRGSGIKDEYVHLYIGDLQDGFTEVYKEKKDCMPFSFQFGVFRFPSGINTTQKLYFQPVATRKNDLDLMEIVLDE